MTTRKQELAALEQEYQKKLKKLGKKMRPDLDAALANPDGIARLLAISDEGWQAAVDAEANDG